MKVVGLICWYDENPAHLAATVASLDGIAEHVVAVDGAYALYPEGKGASPTVQADTIRETAQSLKMGCTIHVPGYPWPGNEVEKRDLMFRLGETLTDPCDWYIILDGDEVVTEAACNVRHMCEASAYDVGEVTFWSYRQHYEPHERPFVLSSMIETQRLRIMFRALRGLKVVGKHYHYTAPGPDGEPLMLWGDGRANMVGADDFSAIRVEHRNVSRDPARNRARDVYYERRDRLKVERMP